MEKVIAKSGISGSTLKLIAIFTMLIDHIAATVILQMINNGIGGQTLIDIYWVMRSIGRMAFPVFCFHHFHKILFVSYFRKKMIRIPMMKP